MPIFPFYWDPTLILIIIGMIISGFASMYVQSTYSRYSNVKSKGGYTASDVCRQILNASQLQNVRLEGIRGNLTDHYNSQDNVLRLSDTTRNSTSVAAIGVAAHEAGHAMQDRDNYGPLRLRSALVPVTNFGQTAAFPILFLGIFMGYQETLINIGILMFSLTLLFQLITLPVEFDASKRAIRVLEEQHLLTQEELPQAKKVLNAAALTYIAAVIASFLSVLRLFLIFGGGRRRR
ncbi:putative metal-dependent peptidase [Alkalibacterium sp. AK22]|uniref:zinc metallopeptidase n=1 Tax=Alkalibacterium sp. AK22 TaxID=1229520 RepID=UPI00044A5E3A|nr:zinc metallopeptidase [Alkalibacterium sp. AK22]EXJ23408.1 putative metal-dependent peptidase [Alkalibacterium sp. AK22]